MQLSIVAASTCFVRKSASILLGGLLTKRDLAFGDHRMHPKKHCVDVLHSSEPSSASNCDAGCRIHPNVDIELPSPVQENTLQAKCLRCCTHQPTALRFAGAERDHSLSLAVRADCADAQHHRTARNTLSGSDATSMVCITPGLDSRDTLLPLEQPNQSRTYCEESSQSLQAHFVQIRRLLQLARQVPALDLYLRSVTGEILCAHRVRTITIS